jgi:hypothetical protein
LEPGKDVLAIFDRARKQAVETRRRVCLTLRLLFRREFATSFESSTPDDEGRRPMFITTQRLFSNEIAVIHEIITSIELNP